MARAFCGLRVAGTCLELRAEGLLGLRQPALLQVDDAQRRVGLRHVGLEAEGLGEILDRRVEVPLLGARLAQHHPHLGGIAVPGEQLREDRLCLRRVVGAGQGESVGELQRGIRVALGVVAQQRGGPVVGLGVEPGHRQHAPQTGVLRADREGAGQGPGGLVEAPRVEVGDAQRVLDPREVGVDRRRLLEELGRAGVALALGLHHAEVEVGADELRRHPPLELEPLQWRERRERRRLGRGQDDRLSAGRACLREPTADLAVLRVPSREPREDLHGGGGLAHLEVREGQGLERAVRFDRGRGRATERLPGLRQSPVCRLERSHQQPSFQEGGPVAAFGGLGLALAQAALGRGDETHEGWRRGPSRPRRRPGRGEARRAAGRRPRGGRAARAIVRAPCVRFYPPLEPSREKRLTGGGHVFYKLRKEL